MAKKTATPVSGIGSVLKALSALPAKGFSSSQPLVTAAFRLPLMSVEALVALAKVYRVSQREVLALVTEQLSGLRDNSDAIKLIEELAGQVSLRNATKRTQALTKGSLLFLNDLSEKLGVPRDAILAGFLSLVGGDLESITHRQRKRVQEALSIVEDLRSRAESAEADLVNVLGGEHPISWQSLTSGIVAVQDELKKELHALNRAVPASPTTQPPLKAASSTEAKKKPKPRAKPSAGKKSSPRKPTSKKAITIKRT